MFKSFRYVIFIGIVLALLITADHYLIKKNPDVLNLSMAMLGEKFRELVPEGGETINNLFDQFVKKVEAKEVDPDDVEQIATNILNLRNQNVKLTPEQAESVISMTYLKPDFVVDVALDSIPELIVASNEKQKKIDQGIIVASGSSSIKRIDPERFAKLGERLKDAFEMNEKIQQEMRSTFEPGEINKHVRFLHKDGIKLIIDTEMKQVMSKVELKQLKEQVLNLEKQHMLVWRENMAKELQENMKAKESELEELKLLRDKHQEQIKQLNIGEALRSLENLTQLEILGYKSFINSDSIRMVIEMKIKEEQNKKEERKDKTQ